MPITQREHDNIIKNFQIWLFNGGKNAKYLRSVEIETVLNNFLKDFRLTQKDPSYAVSKKWLSDWKRKQVGASKIQTAVRKHQKATTLAKRLERGQTRISKQVGASKIQTTVRKHQKATTLAKRLEREQTRISKQLTKLGRESPTAAAFGNCRVCNRKLKFGSLSTIHKGCGACKK